MAVLGHTDIPYLLVYVYLNQNLSLIWKFSTFDLSNVLCNVPYSIIVSHKGFEIVLFMTNKPSYISSLIYRYFHLLIIVNNHFNVQVKIYIFTRDHEKCLICSMMLSVG